MNRIFHVAGGSFTGISSSSVYKVLRVNPAMWVAFLSRILRINDIDSYLFENATKLTCTLQTASVALIEDTQLYNLLNFVNYLPGRRCDYVVDVVTVLLENGKSF